ncbi:tetratricopeptide repeat protein [Kiloniella sp. b19]|uniref:tetratricopeptide repeat protein n=1 Tax=Kiloniella sp. GXU_MW_B19 TaxID=3141326 RepID=UPI0031E05D11
MALTLSGCSSAQTAGGAGDGYGNWPVDDSAVVDGAADVSLEGAYLAGNWAFESNDFKSASDFFEVVRKIDRNNPGILGRSFLTTAATSEHEKTLELARLLSEELPDQPLANTALIVEEALLGNWDRVLEKLAVIPERGVNAIAFPLYRAWTYQALGQTDQAYATLDSLSANEGIDSLRKQQKALIADLSGEQDLARQLFEELMETEQPTLRQQQVAANFHARHGQMEKAVELLEQLQRDGLLNEVLRRELEALRAGTVPEPLVPDAQAAFGEILFSIASLLAREDASDVALIYLQQALRLQTGIAQENSRLFIAELYQAMGQSAEAVASYRTIPSDSPFAWTSALQIAQELDAMGRREEAIASLDELAQSRTDRFEPLLRKGNILRFEERFAEAAVAYSGALERIGTIEDRHWSLFYFRGIAFERAKDWEKAEKDFLKALELFPDQPFVLNYLAYSWVEQERNLQQAEEMLIKAVELRPEDGFIVDSLGWAYYRLGKFEDAVTYLERAVELQAEEATINDHLGDAYWRVGRRHEARFQWRRALSFGPEDGQGPIIEEKLLNGLPPLDSDVVADQKEL